MGSWIRNSFIVVVLIVTWFVIFYAATYDEGPVGKTSCREGYKFIRGFHDYIQIMDSTGHGVKCGE